jgi:eukaryotic-like serine/threonine-protein kinase
MSVRCPACGTSYSDSARFCARDGTRLAGATAAPPDSGSPPADPTARRPRAASPGHGRRAGDAPAAKDKRAGVGQRKSPPSPPAHATLTGRTLDGRYLIERKVGEGGMSFVYQAVDVGTGARRAIKVLSPSLSRDATAMARLRREAELAGKLVHPNICHIEALGQTADGLVYVVMPFVDGEILADRTYRLGHLTLPDVVGFVSEIASGLQAAHDLKIVHRDLKPENIMIAVAGDGLDHAVVMDFGLAKERRAGPELERLTATGIVLGTPEFMSPEQLRGKPLDGRTDQYSLALMVVEMLTGTLPFSGKTQQELMISRLRNHPTPLRKLRPDLDFPGAVERVLQKALARDPDHRYDTAPDFAAALSAATQPGTLGTTTAALKKWFG